MLDLPASIMKRLISDQKLRPFVSSNAIGDALRSPLQIIHGLKRNRGTRRLLTVAAAGIFFVLSLSLSHANPANPCGTFVFSGSPDNNSGEKIVEDFYFAPAKCNSSNCHCGTICYVQIMRAVDLSTGEPRQPSSEQYDRMVTGQSDALLNYWAVDRVDKRIWGYYGRNNDDSFSSDLQPGNNSQPTVLLDEPSCPPNTQFEAIGVPVCIDDASTFRDNLLGCYYYRFTVQVDGSTRVPFNQIGANWNRQAVDHAVEAWNGVARGLHKTSFPPFAWIP
jgi:hypothetical protein